MNEDKTEKVHIYLAKKNDRDEKRQLLIDNEPWRSSKLLGSLMCSVKDIERRIILGNSAFSTFQNVWQKRRLISTSKLLKVYDAQVGSVLLYNAGCWAVPQHIIEKVNITHRRHLRAILNIKWPNRISNEKLYQMTNSEPMSNRIDRDRWRFFGHVLRSTENTPSMLALYFAVECMSKMKGRLGRHRINLFTLLKKDLILLLRNFDIKLNSLRDIYYLRELAANRNNWRKLEKV